MASASVWREDRGIGYDQDSERHGRPGAERHGRWDPERHSRWDDRREWCRERFDRRHAWLRAPRVGGPLRRIRDGRILGGVAGGVAARVGVDVAVVRIAFVVLSLANGIGVIAYALLWLLLPQQGETSSIASRAVSDLRGMALAVALVPLLVIALLLASALHLGWLSTLSWPILISGAGGVLIWRNAPEDERQALRRLGEPLAHVGLGSRRSWRSLARRSLVGIALAAIGVVLLRYGHTRSTIRPFAGIGLVAVGIVLVFGPWWLSVARDLVAERQARVRAEERANMAARVHDSVLQTLAMIQRDAGDPHEVVRLARAQERELRSWLFDSRPPGSVDDDVGTFADAVRYVQRDVEAAHRVPVEVVVVGDCPLTDELRALVAAGREAAVNAAKWSGAPVVSLFAEVDDAGAAIYVRDRGVGFDPEGVPADRQGLAESVRGRMARHGGGAVVRSSIGEGTEIELTMPRAPSRPRQRSGPT